MSDKDKYPREPGKRHIGKLPKLPRPKPKPDPKKG